MKYSKDGYKRNSKDKNNPYNIIPSGNITMEGVDFPVFGMDNLGFNQIMMPGANYTFPGNSVFEIPLLQIGGNPFQPAKRQGVRNNPDGSESTHLMRTETIDGINWVSFPTLFQNEDGTWLDLSQEENWKIPMMEARKRGEVVHFGQDKEAALKFGEGSWKPEEQSIMERGKTFPMAQDGGDWKEKAVRFFSPKTADKIKDAENKFEGYSNPNANRILNMFLGNDANYELQNVDAYNLDADIVNTNTGKVDEKLTNFAKRNIGNAKALNKIYENYNLDEASSWTDYVDPFFSWNPFDDEASENRETLYDVASDIYKTYPNEVNRHWVNFRDKQLGHLEDNWVEGRDNVVNAVDDAWINTRDYVADLLPWQKGGEKLPRLKVINYPYGYRNMPPGHIEAALIDEHGNYLEDYNGMIPYINRWETSGNKPVKYKGNNKDVRTSIINLSESELNQFLKAAQTFTPGESTDIPFTDLSIPTAFGGDKGDYDFVNSNCADGVCLALGMDASDYTRLGITDPKLVMDAIVKRDDIIKNTGNAVGFWEGVDRVTGFSDGVSETWEDIEDTASDVWEGTKDVASNTWDWLTDWQYGGSLPKAQNGISGYNPYALQDQVAVQDNTYYHIPPPIIPTSTTSSSRATISQGAPEPSWYEKLFNVVANPIEAFGRSVHNQDWWTGNLGQGLPISPQHSIDNNPMSGLNMVNMVSNPFKWAEDIGTAAAEGNYADAALQTALIAVPGGKLAKNSKVVKNIKKNIKPKTVYNVTPTNTNVSSVADDAYSIGNKNKKTQKVLDENIWTTQNPIETTKYAMGDHSANSIRKGLLTGEPMTLTEYKIRFPWLTGNVGTNKTIRDLKKSQGASLNLNEYLIPKNRNMLNRFLYPKVKTTDLQPVPTHLLDDNLFSAGSYPLTFNSANYFSKPYKYVSDQVKGATGVLDMPFEFNKYTTYNPNLGYNVIQTNKPASYFDQTIQDWINKQGYYKKGGSLPKAQEGPGTDNERLDAHSVHPVSSQSDWKDLISYNINPLNWPNIFKHGVTRSGEIAYQGGIKEWLAANVRPGDYPNIPQLIGEFEGGLDYMDSIKDRPGQYIWNQVDSEPWTDEQGDLTIDEEAWRMSLGLPGQPNNKSNKYIVKSDNAPSIGAKEGEIFYTTDLFDWDKAMNKFNRIQNSYGTEDFYFSDDLLENFDQYKSEVKFPKNVVGFDKVLDKSGQTIPNTYSFVGKGFDYLKDEAFEESNVVDPFANLTMSIGEDDKGRFISYYDKYDFKNPITKKFVTPVNFYDKRYIKQNNDGQWIIDPDQLKKKDGGGIDYNSLQKGIKWVESLNGELMKNPHSSASGYYGQLFDEIEYDGTRDEFIADTDYQDELFRKRAHGEIKDVPGLIDNGIQLSETYKNVDHGYTPLEIAALSNFLGRQGTREYLGYVLRDGDSLAEVFPHLYGVDVKQANKTPDEYIEKFREGLSKKSKGGEFLNKIKRLNQQLKIFNSGGRISPLAKQELIKLEMIKPEMQQGGAVQQNSYVTQRGDNLSRIARNNNMTLAELLTLNPRFASNPSAIGVGDVVQLSDAPVQNNSTPNMIYKIESGDSLSKIASRYGVRYQDIAALNNISDPSKIMPGQQIRLPDNAVASGPNVAAQQQRANSVYIASQANVYVNSNTNVNEVWNKRKLVNGAWTNNGRRALINEINKDTQANRIVRGMNDNAESTSIDYEIKGGDNLSRIAANNGISLQKLIDDNNISNPNNIQPGQKLTINKSSGKPYLVVDEKAGRMHMYYPGSDQPFKSYPIVSGLIAGDQQTKTVISFYKDGEKLDQPTINKLMEENDFDEVGQIASLPGYSSKTDWSLGNKSTGAGVYTIGKVNEDSGFYDETGQDRNAPSFVLKNQAGNEPGTVIHATPHAGMRGRLNALKYGTSGDDQRDMNVGTNGCINGSCSAMIELFENPDIGEGTQVFVLPEDDGNNFVYENGKVNFYTKAANDEAAETYMAVGPDGKPGTADDIEMESRIGLNETPFDQQGNYKPINITFDKEYYQTNSPRYDGLAEGEEAEFNDATKPFLNSLVDNKKYLMDTLGMDGDTYNDLSMIAFGIYGYESGMGDTNSMAENVIKGGSKLFGVQQTNPDVQTKQGMQNIKNMLTGSDGNWDSVGYTQAKWGWISQDENAMKIMDKLGIDESNYEEWMMDPEKNAQFTIARLYDFHQKERASISLKNQKIIDENEAVGRATDPEELIQYDPYTALPNRWSPTSPGYVDKVNSYTDYITLTETDVDDVDNNLIIKGEYSDDNEASRERQRNKDWKEKILNPMETAEFLRLDARDAIDDVTGGAASYIGEVYDDTVNAVEDVVTSGVDAVSDAVDEVGEWWDEVDLNPFWKLGGEFGVRNQVQFYNDYISGVYKGTRQENSANKLYDKLNRIYYNDSKKSGKSQIDVMRSILHNNR